MDNISSLCEIDGTRPGSFGIVTLRSPLPFPSNASHERAANVSGLVHVPVAPFIVKQIMKLA
jgi:hypothetical protein